MNKKNIILITSSLTALVVSALFLGSLFFGYKFTFIKTFDYNLVNIYYIASISGIFLTLVAICVAIWMPIKIANRQDKIALFKKRYELYTTYRVLVKNAEKCYKFLEGDAIPLGIDISKLPDSVTKYRFWIGFIAHLIPEKGIKELETLNSDYNARLQVIAFADYQILLYIIELENIKYLFSLDDTKEELLDRIMLKLKNSYRDTVDDAISLDDFKIKFKELVESIVSSTFSEIMQEQLEI